MEFAGFRARSDCCLRSHDPLRRNVVHSRARSWPVARRVDRRYRFLPAAPACHGLASQPWLRGFFYQVSRIIGSGTDSGTRPSPHRRTRHHLLGCRGMGADVVSTPKGSAARPDPGSSHDHADICRIVGHHWPAVLREPRVRGGTAADAAAPLWCVHRELAGGRAAHR